MVFQPVGPESPDVYWRRRAVLLGVLGVALVLVLAMCASGGSGADPRAAAAAASMSPADGASASALGGGLDDPLASADASGGAVAAASDGPSAAVATAAASATPSSATPSSSSAALTPAPFAESGDPSAAALDPAAAELATPSASSAATAAIGSPSSSPSVSARPGGTCADASLRVAVSTDARAYAAGAEPRITLTVTNAGATACTRDLGSAALSVVVTSGPDRIWSSDDCGGAGSSKLTALAPGASWSTSVTWSATRTSPGHCTGRVPAKPGFYQVSASAGGVSSALSRFQLG